MVDFGVLFRQLCVRIHSFPIATGSVVLWAGCFAGHGPPDGPMLPADTSLEASRGSVESRPLPPDCPDSLTVVVDGDVVVYADELEVRYRIEPLEGVREVTGDLRIRGDDQHLASLASLGCLKRVGGSFHIEENNAELTTLAGLERLTEVGGDLVIRDNEALRSLNGLDNLERVGGRLEIAYNALSSCDAERFARALGKACDCDGGGAPVPCDQ